MKKVSDCFEQAAGSGHDSLAVNHKDGTTILCISDGAGGIGGALNASKQFVALAENIEPLPNFESLLELESSLRNIDIEIYANPDAGEATGIIALIKNNIVMGASVGDSECWLYDPEFEYELTKLQYRKPLLGSGLAVPIGFGPVCIKGCLLLASDGLFDYVGKSDIKNGIKFGADHLVKLAKSSTGYLQDDCSAIVYKATL